MLGSFVIFIIIVINQGSMIVQIIQLCDYMLFGLVLVDNDWMQNGFMVIFNNVIMNFVFGQFVFVDIFFIVFIVFIGLIINNNVEIGVFINDFGIGDVDFILVNGVVGFGEDDYDNVIINVISSVQEFDLALFKNFNISFIFGLFLLGSMVIFSIIVLNEGDINV